MQIKRHVRALAENKGQPTAAGDKNGGQNNTTASRH
jgi:hypothetical protein